MADDPNVPGPAAERPRAAWRWRILHFAGLCLGTCLAVALYGPFSRFLGGPQATEGGEAGLEYESQAILELGPGRPAVEALGTALNASAELPSLRVRLLSWNTIREVILSRKVDFGREVDPYDGRSIERVHHSVSRRLRVAALGPRHIAVSHRSRSPELNATLVNELVKSFVAEDRSQAQESAKTDLKLYREKLAGAQARLAEVDNQICEFMLDNPWLRHVGSDPYSDYKDAEEQERDVTIQLGESETEIARLKKDLAKERPDVTVKRERQHSEEDNARWAWRVLKDYLGTLGDLERATNPKAAENLARLGEALSRVQEVQKLAVEAAEARKAIELLEAYVRKVSDRNKAPDGNYEEVVRRLDVAMAALPQLHRLAEEDATEDTQPNPKYEQLRERLSAAEKEIGRLQQRKLRANTKVNQLYVLYRRAPALMAQKRGLDEEHAVHAATVEDYAKKTRAAERELQRLMTEAYSSRFKVVEYARDDRTPVFSEGGDGEGDGAVSGAASAGARGGPGGGLLALALACAVGALIGAGAVLMIFLPGRARQRNAEGVPAVPRRRTPLGMAAVGIACLLLPVLAAVAAVVLYPPYPRVGTPRIAGDAQAPQPSSRPAKAGPPAPESPKEIQIESFEAGTDFRFFQLDANGLVTSQVHVFRELLPEDSRVFTVESSDGAHGKIRLYRLRNVATGEAFDFRDVPVRKIGTAGWVIEIEVAWPRIRDELQAKMKVQLSLPIIRR